MQRKISVSIGITVLVVMTIVIIINFIKSNDLAPSNDNLWQQQQTVSKTTQSNQDNTAGKKSGTSSALNEEPVTVCGFKFEVLSAKASKHTDGFPAPISYPDTTEIDENGSIISRHTYVIVKIEVENLKEEKDLLSLGNNTLVVKQGNSILERQEMVSMDFNTELQGQKSYAIYTMQPKEIQTFICAYILKDSLLVKENTLTLRFDPYGQGMHAPDPENYENIGHILLNNFLKSGELT